jgi:hypothetical protein
MGMASTPRAEKHGILAAWPRLSGKEAAPTMPMEAADMASTSRHGGRLDRLQRPRRLPTSISIDRQGKDILVVCNGGDLKTNSNSA